MNLKQRARQLKTDIPAIFLVMQKKETPWYVKVLAVLTVGYALSPIDLIPDFIPILGYLDDVLLLPLMIAAIIKMVPAEIMAQCRVDAVGLWHDGRPKKWFYAIPIFLVWMSVVILVIRAIR